ncbi:methyltransferase domain-containing protein [Streptomyces sp. SL13]|uniref:Methyltransferase domain-containing protein n=1 Tax=Streptantibioticus silvisoli TaxID=2705255 RepID=A0AA90HBD1_9ACTN|nr:methyltransferase domain-containing protein [Streptantibioticus silvisoli]MDI5971647.1 methyltransferase domain-containing protein [Streptantibioticus silvisoli]
MTTDSGELSTTAAFWDAAAATFDDEPDHGMRDPATRASWAARLRSWLPDEPSDVLDLGCGTGSMALLAAEQGHRVTAVDLSPRMARLAGAKLAATDARVLVGDAARPPVADGRFDAVLVRHVLWAMPDPADALRRWARLLRRGGRLILVEGRWGESDPIGLTAADVAALAAPIASRTEIEQLAHDSLLWGRPVADERYAAVIHPPPPRRHAEIVDVHLILRRPDDTVLLARRCGTGYADGLLNAPSGHVEAGEDVRTAMIREAAEEVGVVIDPSAIRVALVMQHRAPHGDSRTGWFFEARAWQGEPVNREPGKCSGIGWYALDALPDDMVAYCRAGFDAYRAGDRFVLHLHEAGDTIVHSPEGPSRAVALPHNDSVTPVQPAGDRP